MGLTTSSNIIDWSDACEKTRSKTYVLLLSALGPMDNSICLPMAPSVLTTTALFSRTSRSLRPRHRTTTLMFVSSLNSSKSRSLRFRPAFVGAEALDSAGDAARDRSDRDVMATLWGLVEGPRDPRRMLARPMAPGRDGGGIVVEVLAPLLRGAARLGSSVAACCEINLDEIAVVE